MSLPKGFVTEKIPEDKPNKEFKLSLNSWHVRLNNFVYGRRYAELQRNFCPYFWGTLLAFPLSIVVGLVKLINKFPKVHVNMPRVNFSPRQEKIIIISVLSLIAGAAGFGIYEAVINGYGWIVLRYVVIYGAIISLPFVARSLMGKYRDSHPYQYKPRKERDPNIAVTAFKSWKDKNCPRITWK